MNRLLILFSFLLLLSCSYEYKVRKTKRQWKRDIRKGKIEYIKNDFTIDSSSVNNTDSLPIK